MFNVSAYLARSARLWPHHAALCENERCVATFAELEVRVQELADYLHGVLGLRPGDRVALFAENRARYLELMLAFWRASLIVTPVNARLHPTELAWIVGDSGARLCLTSSERLQEVSAALAQTGLGKTRVAVGDIDADPETWPSAGSGTDCSDADPAIAWLFYTSGTTGKPKGVMMTHENLRQVVLNYLADIEPIRPGECIVHFGPLSHGTGVYMVPHLACGAANVVARGIEPSIAGVAMLARGHGPAALFMAPTLVQRLLRSHEAATPLDSIRTIAVGGGPMHVESLKAAYAAFGQRLVQIYGQGESPMTITCMHRTEILRAIEQGDDDRLRSVGHAFTGVEVEIRDQENRPVPPGTAGEIVVRGPTVMRGYWNRPDATLDTLRDGWLRTGDVGAMDGHGFVTLLDRSKDVIISGGMNIYSREVEDVLLSHPGVVEAAVVGRPDAEWGEAVVACLVAAPGAALTLEQLDRHCLDRLARFKRPRAYRFVTELPKNNYGKVLKRELRELIGPQP